MPRPGTPQANDNTQCGCVHPRRGVSRGIRVDLPNLDSPAACGHHGEAGQCHVPSGMSCTGGRKHFPCQAVLHPSHTRYIPSSLSTVNRCAVLTAATASAAASGRSCAVAGAVPPLGPSQSLPRISAAAGGTGGRVLGCLGFTGSIVVIGWWTCLGGTRWGLPRTGGAV